MREILILFRASNRIGARGPCPIYVPILRGVYTARQREAANFGASWPLEHRQGASKQGGGRPIESKSDGQIEHKSIAKGRLDDSKAAPERLIANEGVCEKAAAKLAEKREASRRRLAV